VPKSQLNFKYLSFLGGLLLVFGLIVFTNLPFLKSIVLISFFLTTVLLFLKPLGGLFLLLFLRPAIDRVGTGEFLKIGNLSLNYNAILGLITLFWGSVMIFKYRHQFRKIPSKVWIVTFLVISLLSLIFAPGFQIGLEELVRISSIFILYAVAFLLINSRKQFKKLLTVFLTSAFLPVFSALRQYLTDQGEVVYGEFFKRFFGTFFHPNSLAFFLVFLIALLLFSAKQQREKSPAQFFYLILSLLTFLVLLGTYTRGAWLGALIIFIAFSIYGFKRFTLGFALIIFLFYLIIPTLQERINDIIRLEPFSSLMWRFRLWQDMLPQFLSNPLFGHGLMSFRYLSENLQGLRTLPAPEAHNDYLRLAIEVGIIGMLGYLLIYLRLVIFYLKKYLKTKDSFLKDIAFVSLLLLFTFMIMALGDNILRGTATQWALFSFLGATTSLFIKHK
jgi:O-antigen ligase